MYIFDKILILIWWKQVMNIIWLFCSEKLNKHTCLITEVYSSTTNWLANWPPLTVGQNSILTWALKLSPLNQKVKSNKNCIDYWEKALFTLFFTFRSHQRSIYFRKIRGLQKCLDKDLYPSSLMELFDSLCQIEEAPLLAFVTANIASYWVD